MPFPFVKPSLLIIAALSATPSIAQVKDIDLTEGTCVSTKISKIGHRLEGNDDFSRQSGSAVTFANGVFLVSYNESKVVRAANVGDSVLLCPVATQQGCRATSAPTRTVLMMHRKTSNFWKAYTSSHSCDGA